MRAMRAKVFSGYEGLKLAESVDDVSAAGIPSPSYGTDGPQSRWFSGGQNCASAGNRRISRQRGDATGACFGRKTRHLQHDQPYKS